jgi:hypothetical protein
MDVKVDIKDYYGLFFQSSANIAPDIQVVYFKIVCAMIGYTFFFLIKYKFLLNFALDVSFDALLFDG